ncbi:MAG: ASCH domain-containing protein [Methylotenera sp.]|nr:ASCH domain-containing protein [Methylotenera sp.]
MSLFPEFSEQPSGKAVLIAIKPKYADLILAGTKKVELRRSWPSNDIGVMVIYSSAPVQKLVGAAFIDRIEECDFERLWTIADSNGGGVTYEELKSYVEGKKKAYGVMLDQIKIAEIPTDPKDLFPDFTPPQSFLYLSPIDFQRVMRSMFPSEKWL